MSVFIAGALVFALMLSLEARLNPLRDENA